MNGWLGSRVWIELADGIVLDSGVGLLIDWMAWFLDLAWRGGLVWGWHGCCMGGGVGLFAIFGFSLLIR